MSGPSEDEGTEFVLGRDYTEEDGLVVFTAYYLLGRGKCCRLNCRNCPWGRSPAAVAERQRHGSSDPSSGDVASAGSGPGGGAGSGPGPVTDEAR